MITFSDSVEIRGSPERVFDFVADPGNAPRWQSGVVQSTVLSGGPIGPGTRFTELVRVGLWKVRADCRVTEFERPTRVGFVAESRVLSYAGTFEFQSREDVTVLTMTGTGALRGALRLLEPIVARDARRGSREELERIRALVEGGEATEPGSESG